ncbi:hypothetical protein EST38_g11617 [Candolleomyces aberdarensis]|uniref:Uncharacterized protein n=1 Tax=Candolleomyces aberdarensis TaxID=2316362 RepID=A0A4Q2D4E7_9AGAR|nr:hypothetical protein EST38_g11617 [Candolleomyces aberdarensis]
MVSFTIADYVQLLHNHIPGEWEDPQSASPVMRATRHLARGVEVGRASATRKVAAKKIIAYTYLRQLGWVVRDPGMEVLESALFL